MDESLLGIMEILGPVLLLIVLVWLVMRSRRKPNQPTDTTERTERATDDLYREEEQRRRDGTDDL